MPGTGSDPGGWGSQPGQNNRAIINIAMGMTTFLAIPGPDLVSVTTTSFKQRASHQGRKAI
jgi:hypothetical protein